MSPIEWENVQLSELNPSMRKCYINVIDIPDHLVAMLGNCWFLSIFSQLHTKFVIQCILICILTKKWFSMDEYEIYILNLFPQDIFLSWFWRRCHHHPFLNWFLWNKFWRISTQIIIKLASHLQFSCWDSDLHIDDCKC